MAEQTVDKVVSVAMERLQEAGMPGLVMSLAKNHYFVTAVVDETDKISIFVDFTSKIEMDYDKFVKKSYNLYNQFHDIERWYKC
jgi:hypothetical protein